MIVMRGFAEGSLVFFFDPYGSPIGLCLYRDWIKFGPAMKPGENCYKIPTIKNGFPVFGK